MSLAVSARTIKSGLDDITFDKQKADEAEKYKITSSEEKVKKQKQEFFTLLSVQLKNQDPTAPMDTNQMSQQIFAINQVEQQLETNKHLNDIKTHFVKSQMTSAVSYIDKMAYYEGNQIVLNDNKIGLIKYALPQDAVSANLVIRNAAGLEVFREHVPSAMGEHVYKWHAQAEMPNGVYSYDIEATDEDENVIASRKYGYGVIKGIFTKDGESSVEINGKEVAHEQIMKFTTEESLNKEMKL